MKQDIKKLFMKGIISSVNNWKKEITDFDGIKWMLSNNIYSANKKHSYTAEEIAQKVFGHIDLKQLKG